MVGRFTNRTEVGNRQDESFSFKNESGEVMPAYGVYRATAYASRVFTADKPDGSEGLYFANGPVDIADGAYSSSLSWIRSQPVMFEPGASVSVGDACGPISGQWYMGTSGTGWRVFVPPNDDYIAFVKKDAAGGGGGGLFAWGTSTNVDCAAGNLDVILTHVSECPPDGWPDYSPGSQTISPVWDLETEGGWPLFPGHTEAELTGKRCRIEYVYEIDGCDGRWVLLDIYTSDGCI